MRINLVTPFAEKDAAKALGARWDSAEKRWYIVDVADLTPFLRWIPNMDAATASAIESAVLPNKFPAKTVPIKRSAGIVTTSTSKLSHCGCNVRAWEECPHTALKPPDVSGVVVFWPFEVMEKSALILSSGEWNSNESPI